MKTEEIIAAQEAEIKKLSRALKEIAQMSDSGSYVRTLLTMKNIASKALTNRKQHTHINSVYLKSPKKK